jgi:probable rRNA maturation factor
MSIKLEIASELDDWNLFKEINTDLISNITKNIINRYRNLKILKEIELSVLLTNDKKMLSLNSEFRGVKKPTNVLSFQDLEINWRHLLEFKPDADHVYLGDIAFGYQTIKEEAKEKQISFEDHFKHLLVHAILHLIGYDHIEDEEAQIMEALEIEILSNYNIKSPY